jgi:hypothetical protein
VQAGPPLLALVDVEVELVDVEVELVDVEVEVVDDVADVDVDKVAEDELPPVDVVPLDELPPVPLDELPPVDVVPLDALFWVCAHAAPASTTHSKDPAVVRARMTTDLIRCCSSRRTSGERRGSSATRQGWSERSEGSENPMNSVHRPGVQAPPGEG